MTEAKTRKCPKCKTPIIKSDGCNKMTCRCGTKMCYICRKQLTGNNPYAHFCQTPHCTHKSCKTCTLYSNADEDDERAMREAGEAAAQSYRDEVKEKEGGADVNIDVNGIMSTGVAARAPPAEFAPPEVPAARPPRRQAAAAAERYNREVLEERMQRNAEMQEQLRGINERVAQQGNAQIRERLDGVRRRRR
jgi:hypothetical protein